MRRAENSGKKLSDDDASVIKGMLLRGDRQHDIAAWFGVNGGRIGEISKGKKFLDVTPKTSNLPRPGPYLSGQASESLMHDFRKLRSKARSIIEIDNLDPSAKTLASSMLDQLEAIIRD